MEKIDPELAKNKFIFPDDDDPGRGQAFRTLDPAEETKYSRPSRPCSGN